MGSWSRAFLACVSGAKMGGEGEEIPLFPVLPIPYPFRRLLRKLARFELLSPGADSSYSYHVCFDHNI